ncbi:anthranilate synthase component I [bacterium]|nr:anthranilate synthase component I [bacterium]MBU1752881.1 anthranilate synthase component I [bacterium]
MMDCQDFKQKAKEGANLIPVYREILADMETPVSAFQKIAMNTEYSYLLESVEGGESIGRYSFLGSNPFIIFQGKGDVAEISRAGVVERFEGVDPLVHLLGFMNEFQSARLPELPRFFGGAVGYIGYDYVRCIENIPDTNPDSINLPDVLFVITDTILVFDHVRHTIKVVANVWLKNDDDIEKAYYEAINKITGIIERLKQPLPVRNEIFPVTDIVPEIDIQSNITKSEFESNALKAKEYIASGDIFQVVLSQRFQSPVRADALSLYRALRWVNPSPYMFLLKFGKLSLIGSSPELLVRVDDGVVETRPIAGTRPRGKTKQEDEAYEKDLLSDPKELAEHIMLVDLGRNDVGRVCEYNSITLPEFEIIEKYSHVMHMVTSVKGKLMQDKNYLDALRACFPAGTVTGAPKVRAMEIIDELETSKRGPYAGCIGYFGFSGNMDTCITIRTMVAYGEKVYVQAGAGIVADSQPEKEYEETVNKAKGMLKAVAIAEQLYGNRLE